MKRLYVNKLGEVQLPYYIKAGSSIVISRATLWIDWYNIWKTARIIIVKDQKHPDKNPTYIDFKLAYTL